MESTLKKRSEMYSIVQKISSVNPIDVTLQGFKILLKLLQNIHNNPSALKYRLIKTSNNTIKNSLLIVNSISELIEYIGYKKTKEDFYELSSDGSIENVDICIGILNQYINQIEEKVYVKEAAKTINMNNEEVRKEKERMIKKMNEEKKAKEDILKLIEQDKLERSNKKI